MVYKRITLIGVRQTSFEAAVEDALDRPDETLENVA